MQPRFFISPPLAPTPYVPLPQLEANTLLSPSVLILIDIHSATGLLYTTSKADHGEAKLSAVPQAGPFDFFHTGALKSSTHG